MKNILTDECKENLISKLCGEFYDQEDNIKAIVEGVFSHLKNPASSKPLTFLLYGPLGV